jgi:TRAP-type C4-dicarboxylate transport system permease small subunit
LLARAARAVAWAANAVSVTALLVVVAILVYEICARFLFNRPTGWSDEATAFLMPAIVFLAAGHTLLSDGHIRIDMLYARLTGSPRRWVALLNESTGLAVLGMLVWFSILMVERVHRSEDVATAGTYSFPAYIPAIVVPAGLLIMALAQLLIWLHAVLAVALPREFSEGAEAVVSGPDDATTIG